ncbi:MAG: (Fe-S)-binding protein [Anaerolineales bacterium]|nr:(Fe-S)-binding protein [Anaerolineales bacterium]
MSRNVQLFVTCIVDTLYPDIGEAVVRVLQKTGVNIGFPEGQTCCGQPAFNAGMRTEARKMAEHTIQVFEDSPGDIVIPSGSCTGMLKHGYLELFAEDAQWLSRAQNIADRTFELTQYLVDVLEITNFDSKFEGKITYHPSCHLMRDVGIDRQPMILLDNVRGAELTPLQKREECCGFGGLFSIEHPEISKEMLERKINNLLSSESETLVACDAGCMAHISGGLHRRKIEREVLHIAEILAIN